MDFQWLAAGGFKVSADSAVHIHCGSAVDGSALNHMQLWMLVEATCSTTGGFKRRAGVVVSSWLEDSSVMASFFHMSDRSCCFVEEGVPWPVVQQPRKRKPLLLAARKHVGLLLGRTPPTFSGDDVAEADRRNKRVKLGNQLWTTV